MSTFRSIEELVKSLDREKELLKEMFAKRKSLSFRYDYALEMTEYKEERIRYLIDYGVIRDTGDFLEMEDIYLKFFEDVLEVNEEINVSFVQDYLTRLNENIDYYLKENNEQRKYNYQREVKRCLKNIALTTVRNVMDLKRNMDNTYKNEPNYKIKKTKLVRLDEKRNNIALLIRKSEELIDYGQPVFFRVAMDVQMRNVVPCVSLLLCKMSFLQNDGLSHSEIFGSKVICTCPKLIAAYHVLHRLREPRHPPCALAYFLSNVLFSYWYW